MTTQSLGRKLVCSLGVTALILTSTAAVTPAFAVDVVASKPAEYGNIDATAKGSIIVHKHQNQNAEYPQYADPETGSFNGVPSAGVDGVTFDIYKLDYNLTTQQGWDELEKLKIDKDTVKGKNPMSTQVTENGGKATFENLELGVYLVVERDSSGAQVSVDGQDVSVIDQAAPFVVTIPYPNNHEERQGKKPNGKWLYNVNVFPKNSVSRMTKDVEDQAKHGLLLGSEVRYPVTAQIPTIPTGNKLKYFIITDKMSEHFDANSLGVDTVQIGADGSVPLTEETDYKVTKVGHTVHVALTKAGLTKAGQHQKEYVHVTFKGKLTSVSYGSIDNGAEAYIGFIPNDDPSEPPTVPPVATPEDPEGGGARKPLNSPRVITKWGQVTILKKDAADGQTGLKDAKFKVYAAKNPYPTDGKCVAEKGEEVKKNGQEYTVTTGEEGKAVIDGLFVADWKSGQPVKDFRCYVLEETEAPAGFIKPKGDKALTPITVYPGTSKVDHEFKIENVKRDAPNLPLTGGQGVAAMMIAGGLLLAVSMGAAVVFVRRMRRQ
ncbi:SpaH/EbpB family LPXTG-anchored major pilin [Corynebacterium diphtheriae bv. mitis]|uniref:SpaH/EbpB family LPXTG-anchored major pilin n=1 Tax=Corynebacterium diphtheriae TaxID=1717 RepID=UPI0013CBEBA4|nr:SpaH/EbpB family LPXTG-anchored major pilin [Corynebacterium diphtheriae bv. mitis]CAB0832530.1 isopeptide-forming domain-containing fimbrial protein [Corynebacterium diphtheriae]CAB0890539.1 isopeptide-forming domain-containing fimbrial protein [Corynebacterium diphtheriae]